MYISKENAQKIVTEISGIIQQHVNMMDDTGHIIASTDSQRVGDHHAAAYRIITEGLQELNIHDDEEYRGARKGINLPVMFRDQIVGVIGVTGDYDEISKYSQIIKKMTEILLIETFSSEQKKLDERIRDRFIDDWLNYDGAAYYRAFLDRGNRFGIDITLPRRVFVARIVDLTRYSDSIEGQLKIDAVGRAARQAIEAQPHGVFGKTDSAMIGIVPDLSDDKLFDLAVRIKESIQQKCSVEIHVGIDQKSSLLKTAYARANRALNACKYSQSGICFYSEITFELFMDELSLLTKKEFMHRVFKGIPDSDIGQWIYFLKIYYDANASIQKAAEQLFIHKNTLQYKLHKLAETTGYDPRRYNDAALYLLAIQFYDHVGDE